MLLPLSSERVLMTRAISLMISDWAGSNQSFALHAESLSVLETDRLEMTHQPKGRQNADIINDLCFRDYHLPRNAARS